MQRKKTLEKIKRLAAWIGIIVIVGMYLLTLILGLTANENTKGWLMASIVCTVVIPVLIYAMILVMKVLDQRHLTPKIKNIIFDIGKVLVDYDWDEFIRGLGYTEEQVKIIGGAMFHNKAWMELDRGVLNTDECEHLFISNAPEYEKEIRHVFRASGAAIIREEFAIPWIKELKARGYRTYFLSNYSLWMETESAHALDFLPLLDGGVFSHRVKLLKPDAAIYQNLLDKYPEIRPEESVFLDDSEKNVKGAEALGFHTVLVKNHTQAVEDLEKLLSK